MYQRKSKMTQKRDYRTPKEQRCFARKLRGRVRNLEKPRTMEESAESLGVSRPHAYRLVADLEAWEAQATRQEEIDELEEQFKFVSGYDPIKWIVVSGQRILDYAHGLDDISKPDNIEMSDSLLK